MAEGAECLQRAGSGEITLPLSAKQSEELDGSRQQLIHTHFSIVYMRGES